MRGLVFFMPTTAASTALSGTLRREDPTQFYRLDKCIGKGSYGKVYRAHPKAGGPTVAFKVLPLDEGESSISLDMQRELLSLQECSHPRVVNYHDAYIRDNRLWIAMEYCLCSVQSVMRLQQAPLSEPEIAAVLVEALRGLQYLHTERQIIHRDVKAGNILLTDKGEVKLADFGVSAQMTGTLTKRNTVIGTPMWMSPEMIEAGSYDQRTDIWSLGITAIELAEMNPPHHDVNPPVRVLFMIPSHPPPTLTQPEQWSEAFTSFLAQCLTKDPASRPDSTQALAHPFATAAETSGGAALTAMTRRHLRLQAEKRSAKRATSPAVEGSTLKSTLRLDGSEPGSSSHEPAASSDAADATLLHAVQSGAQDGTCTLGGSSAAAGIAGGWTLSPALPSDGTLPRDSTLQMDGTLPRDGTLQMDGTGLPQGLAAAAGDGGTLVSKGTNRTSSSGNFSFMDDYEDEVDDLHYDDDDADGAGGGTMQTLEVGQAAAALEQVRVGGKGTAGANGEAASSRLPASPSGGSPSGTLQWDQAGTLGAPSSLDATLPGPAEQGTLPWSAAAIDLVGDHGTAGAARCGPSGVAAAGAPAVAGGHTGGAGPGAGGGGTAQSSGGTMRRNSSGNRSGILATLRRTLTPRSGVSSPRPSEA